MPTPLPRLTSHMHNQTITIFTPHPPDIDLSRREKAGSQDPAMGNHRRDRRPARKMIEMLPDFKFRAYDYSPPGTEEIKGTSLLQAIFRIILLGFFLKGISNWKSVIKKINNHRERIEKYYEIVFYERKPNQK